MRHPHSILYSLVGETPWLRLLLSKNARRGGQHTNSEDEKIRSYTTPAGKASTLSRDLGLMSVLRVI
jgi:hypothetical protein